MDIRKDGWLSEIIGRPAFRVDVNAGEEGVHNATRSHAREQTTAFYYAKVSTKEIDPVRQLCAAGFHVVDVNVTLQLDREPRPSRSQKLPVVRAFQAGDEGAVLDIAGSAYEYSRFHLDDRFDKATAHRVKREWCHNYVRGVRGDHLFVALDGSQPIGFLAALMTNGQDCQTAIIDLIGVARDRQRRGAGAALVRAFCEHYRGRASALQVGTQVANIPSLRLYEHLGFSIIKSQYVLHHHFRI